MRSEEAAFLIEVDPQRRYVELALRTMWDVATMRRYESELRRLLRLLPAAGCPLGRQVTLLDLRESLLQGQEVATILAELAADTSIASRRVAMVSSRALLRSQARRLAPNYRLFEDRDEALAWLFEPEA